MKVTGINEVTNEFVGISFFNLWPLSHQIRSINIFHLPKVSWLCGRKHPLMDKHTKKKRNVSCYLGNRMVQYSIFLAMNLT